MGMTGILKSNTHINTFLHAVVYNIGGLSLPCDVNRFKKPIVGQPCIPL